MKDFSIMSQKKCTAALVREAFFYHIREEKLPPVFLCIGTDRITGDSLGPLIGSALQEKHSLKCFVYGSLKHPVTARNVRGYADFIRSRHPNNALIAIDAALGRADDVGIIRVAKKGLAPAAAMGKKLALVGDISLTAVVNQEGALHGTRLAFVCQLAEEISLGIATAMTRLEKRLSFSTPNREGTFSRG